MARSASKLRSTRSGVFKVDFLLRRIADYLYRAGVLFSKRLRWRLQYHHWHRPAGSRGSRACATAARKTSRQQMSWCWGAARQSDSYSRCGFRCASCATLRTPRISKSRSIAGPTEIKSERVRGSEAIKTSLTATRREITLTYANLDYIK